MRSHSASFGTQPTCHERTSSPAFVDYFFGGNELVGTLNAMFDPRRHNRSGDAALDLVGGLVDLPFSAPADACGFVSRALTFPVHATTEWLYKTSNPFAWGGILMLFFMSVVVSIVGFAFSVVEITLSPLRALGHGANWLVHRASSDQGQLEHDQRRSIDGYFGPLMSWQHSPWEKCPDIT